MGNGKITEELKGLGLKINGVEPSGETVSEIIGDIESNYNGASKDYVNSLMSGALKRSIVETLPVENIDTNTIYMVLDAQAEEQGNVYNEYLYIENNWELIGTTAPSGTEVIANPTLAGTEDTLTGLEVDGTKYAVPQGGGSKLYAHHINVSSIKLNSNYDTLDIIITIINSNENEMTYGEVIDYIDSIIKVNAPFYLSGVFSYYNAGMENTNTYNLLTWDGTYRVAEYMGKLTITDNNNLKNSEYVSFKDNVVEL